MRGISQEKIDYGKIKHLFPKVKTNNMSSLFLIKLTRE